MTIVVCKVLLGVILTLFNFGTTVNASAAQESTARNSATVSSNAPRIENGRIETRRVAGALTATMAAVEKDAARPMWVGYAVKAVAGERTVCCGNYSDSRGESCGRCELETDRDHWNNSSNKKGAGAVKLEGGVQLLVLFRLEDRHLTRIKVASGDCVLDAGGLAFVWLTDVKPAESVAVLGEFVRRENLEGHARQSIGNEALTAIALHDGQEAEVALESFAGPAQPEELRKQAAFWLGAARGKEGLVALQRMAKKDPSAEVRAHVAFALSISKESAALEEMIRMAHEDESGHVRGQAIFWLAQNAGNRAVSAIDSAIANDPDTEVEKQAVFALSQLPKDEGVPKLIQVAENNRNPEVRKQAMFWLGQSQDPRALGFFERVLLK
jgi:HEAT repeat protein